jgi:glycosyltransferase involved in cell wall biosynthesis
MIFIASHVLFDKEYTPFHGTGAAIGQYLHYKNINHIFIKHPLRNGYATRIEAFIDEKLKIEIRGVRWIPFPLRIIQDFIVTALVVYRYGNKIELFIGIDPLNACFGLLLKRVGRIRKVVFYTADWTPTRFHNYLLNVIYHTIDRHCIAYANEVWNVSKRITTLRRQQGVEKERNKFVPNTPFIVHTLVKPICKIRKHDLVYATSFISSDMNYDALIQMIEALKKRYTDIRLLLIGDLGEYGRKLRRGVKASKLSRHIKFLGLLSHDKVMDIVSKSGIGLALYRGDNSWDEYCDSMKVREYLACGIPVIMTSISPTSSDIIHWKAGLVIDDPSSLSGKIDSLFSNSDAYVSMRLNAIYLGQKYDFSGILDQLFISLLK